MPTLRENNVKFPQIPANLESLNSVLVKEPTEHPVHAQAKPRHHETVMLSNGIAPGLDWERRVEEGRERQAE